MRDPNAEVSYDLIREASALNNNANFLISPLSIEYALSMLRDGADGNTYNEISRALKGFNLSGDLNILN